ncbi:amidohydrolase family protein [Nonomuraea typhae]|uniref:amidohydrolase family protein n=1 Tax=Nonomuraea typhae TaxID=2603600 RepID=UPI0012F7B37C|nr:amidohydrolase family protein [Nonomuraea typhae]
MSNRRIFDAHAHLAPGEESLSRLLKEMDNCGIDRAIVVAGAVVSADVLSRQIIEGGFVKDDADNDAVRAGCARSGGRLAPLFFANPHRPASVYREQGPDFQGLKLAPSVHGVPFEDERTVALIEVAVELGHNVYAHCLHRADFGVRDLICLAARFPDTTFILGHAGVGDLDFYGIDLIKPEDNILLETSCGLTATVRTALSRLGAQRVVFGSEYPMQSPRVELTKLEVLNLTAEEWQAVAWDNAHRFLGAPR